MEGGMDGWMSGQASEVLLLLFNMPEMSSWTSLELGHCEWLGLALSRWWAFHPRKPLLKGGNSSRSGSQHARSPRAQPGARRALQRG